MLGREQSRLQHDTPSFGFSKVRTNMQWNWGCNIEKIQEIKYCFYQIVVFFVMMQPEYNIPAYINSPSFYKIYFFYLDNMGKLKNKVILDMQISVQQTFLSPYYWPIYLNFTPPVVVVIVKLLSHY